MPHRLVRVAAATAVAWALAAPTAPAARAQADAKSDAKSADAKKKEAHRHYQRAIDLSHGGLYESAIEELKRAYEISPHFAVLYNLGQAYVALGKPVEAADAFQRYLDEGGAQVAAARRDEVQAAIAAQQASIATVAVDADVAGAMIAVDGVDVGRAPLAAPVRAAAGTHEIAAALDGYRRAAQSITVAGQQQARVSFRMERAAAVAALPAVALAPAPVPAAPAAAAPLAPVAPRAARTRTAGYVVAGAGVALGAVALAHFLWNRGRYEDWSKTDSELRTQQSASDYIARQSANNQLATSIGNASVITVSLGIAAGAALTTGIILVVTAPRGSAAEPPASPTHAWGITPSSVVWTARF
jgi:hypothetical protein